MQAIVTKYSGPTDTKSAYITAKCEAGSLRVDVPDGMDGQDSHAAAAMALVRKLGWNSGKLGDRWVCGSISTGYVFVLRSEFDSYPASYTK